LAKIAGAAGLLFLILFLGGFDAQAQPSGGSSDPQKMATGNKADQNLKSVARVNPLTLAMEMSLPLAIYPGRNGNSLPIGFSYSSKLWRMDSSVTWFYLQNGNGAKRYLTDIAGKFAERTSAGWTSMSMPPRLDEKLDIYNQYGKPFTQNLSDSMILELFEAGNNANLLQSCGWRCTSWVRTCSSDPRGGCDANSGYHCESIETVYCESGPSETPAQNPDRMNYVKRVRVEMPDGSSHEFRKSDAIFGYCLQNNPFNGSNCEQLGEDREGTFLAVDGSGMKLVRPDAEDPDQRIFLYLPNGSRYIFPANAQGVAGHFATEFIDVDGNRLAFEQIVEGNDITNKWTDTLGRQIVDPMPYNWDSQRLSVGTFNANLPGLNGVARNFKMKWLPLKPPGCEDSEDDFCGKGDNGEVLGALENQGEKLYYTSPKFCQGNLTTDLPSGEILFPLSGLGLRNCNPFKLDENENEIAARFNPVVLAKLELPNGTSYQFKYNRYGEITTIIYPSGSYEQFDYALISPLAGFHSPAFDQTNRGVVERRVYDSANVLEQRWNYSAAIPNPTDPTSPYVLTTIGPHKDNPDSQTQRTKTERYLTRVVQPSPGSNLGNFGFDDPRGGLAYDERTYDESGNLRERTLTEYIVAAPRTGGDSRAVRDARAKRSLSIVIDGDSALATLNTNTYDDAGTGDYEHFSQLNLKETKSYPYVVIAKTTAESTLLSWTTIDALFAGVTPSSIGQIDYLYSEPYKTRGIIGIPTDSRSLNPSNTSDIVAKTQTVFDETTFLVSGSSLPGNFAGTWVNPGSSYRAKPTTTKAWHKDSNTWIVTHCEFDQYGNVRKSWDANAVAANDASRFTEIEYSSTYAFAYPTLVKTPVPDPTGQRGSNQPLTTTTVFDFTTGLPLSVTNPNGKTTTSEYENGLLRAVKVTQPNGRQTINEYTDTIGSIRVKTRSQITASDWKESYVFYDDFSRISKTQSVDSSGDVFVITHYDKLGRVSKVSNPFRNVADPSCSVNVECATNTYDNFGRIWKVTTPDNAVVETTYGLAAVGNQIGTVVTVKDQASKERRSISNAQGAIIRVDEPNNSNQLGTIDNPAQPTFYSYDKLQNLKEIVQGAQTRTFVYDSLLRLKTATNPESGTIQYQYDFNGNLILKTDARLIQTSYTFDNLNRVKIISYANEPSGQTPTSAVNYFYDNLPNAKGTLIKVSSDASTTEFTAFDTMGHVTAHKQITDGNTYTTAYAYNLAGMITEETYPSSRVVKTAYDAEGDLARVESKKNSSINSFKVYANQFDFTPAGMISSFRSGNGRFASTQYNNRLQTTQIAFGTSKSATNLLKLDYSYGTTTNNGNVQSQQITVPAIGGGQGFTTVQNYTYDFVNRLKQADEKPLGYTQAQCDQNPTLCWKQTYTYDRYGNRNFDEANTTTLPKNCGTSPSFTVCAADAPLVNPSINTADNRLDGYVFDDSGNLTRDAENRKFTYNAQNKQTKVETVDVNSNPINTVSTYTYDGDGKRVKKYVPSTGEITIFIYNANAKIVAEYSTIVEPSATAKLDYLIDDYLGTPRIHTDQNGQVVSRHDYHPFGEEISTAQRVQTLGYVSDNVRQQFTGYERDAETNFDYAHARTYFNRLGRYTSIDPGPFDVLNPQVMNRYSYAINNPLKYIDPDGRKIRLTGTSAEVVYMKTYLENISGYKLDVDKKGNVKIVGTIESKTVSKDFAIELKAILDDKKKATFNMVSEVESILVDDGEEASNGNRDMNIDVNDIRQLDKEAPELGAALTIHALREGLELAKGNKYNAVGQMLLNGKIREESPSAHDIALEAENRVMSGMLGTSEVRGRDTYIANRNTATYDFKYTTVTYTISLIVRGTEKDALTVSKKKHGN
jgi:RHS repeat-associated protein